MTDSLQEPDVIEVLTTDHTEATSLIAQIRGTSASEERRDLGDTLISELVRHSVAEEMFVHPAVQEHLPDGDQAVELVGPGVGLAPGCGTSSPAAPADHRPGPRRPQRPSVDQCQGSLGRLRSPKRPAFATSHR